MGQSLIFHMSVRGARAFLSMTVRVTRGVEILVAVALVASSVALGRPAIVELGELAHRPIQKVDFIPALDGFKQAGLPLSMLDASAAITFLGRKFDEHCSAAVVSDSGNMLTAGHCLAFCLADKNLASEVSDPSDGFHKIEVNEVSFQSTAARLTCAAKLNGTKVNVEVLAAHTCQILAYGDRTARAAAIKKCASEPDFALIHPVGAKGKSQVCLRTGRTDDLDGRDMFSFGFPIKTERGKEDPSALDSDGNHQYVSFGRFIRQHYCVIPNKNERHSLKNVEAYDGYLQSDNDSVDGSSGGPVVRSDRNELVGVAARSASKQGFFCKGAAYATSIDWIRETVLEMGMTDGEFDSFMSCDKNAASPAKISKQPSANGEVTKETTDHSESDAPNKSDWRKQFLDNALGRQPQL